MCTRNHPVVEPITRGSSMPGWGAGDLVIRHDGIVDIIAGAIIVVAITALKRTPGPCNGGGAVPGRGIHIQICSQLRTEFARIFSRVQSFQMVVVVQVFTIGAAISVQSSSVHGFGV